MKTKKLNIQKSDCLAEIEVKYKTKVNPADRLQITKAEDTFEVLKQVFNPDKIEYREEFIVLFLNRANKILGWAKISEGGTAGTFVDIKIILQLALNANASGIIISHNHPSGNLMPSEIDKTITRKIKQACEILDINLLDHIIVTENTFFSFANEGLM